MRSKKGFTLIELLAVIVILTIIMVIAVPKILNVIKSSIDTAWINNVRLIKHAIVTNSSIIDPQTNSYTTSPKLLCNNETDTDKEVTNNIKTISKVDSTKINCKKDTDYIFTLIGLRKFNGKRAQIICKADGECKIIFDDDVQSDNSQTIPDEVDENDIKCIAASNLKIDSKIGTIGHASNTLIPGTALDCKVKKNGGYTERFYYVSDLSTDNNYAVLIYNNNTKVTNGVTSIYNSAGPSYGLDSYNGPTSAINNLPPVTDWDNISLRFDKRSIINDVGGNKISNYTLPSEFSYSGKAARLLTYQELLNACGPNNYNGSSGSIDFSSPGYLLNCNFLLDNTCLGAHGYWLETPSSKSNNEVVLVYGCNSGTNYRYQLNHYGSSGGLDGVRPVIEVKKTQIDLSYANMTENHDISNDRVVVLPKGKYKLEVWGASGGDDIPSTKYASKGGYGAYATGEITLNSNTALYVNIGGSSNGNIGGTNGGANGNGSAGGGGATHIATSPGKLKDLSDNRSSILIVAGGGGGANADTDKTGYNTNGGNGGGYIGGSTSQIEDSCTSSCTKYNYPSGGTQENGGISITNWSTGTTSTTQYVGTFGQGATGNSNYGGGGGGYFGGASGQHNAGAGGSGYLNPILSNAAMYCYDCPSNDTPSIKTISNGLASENPEPMYSKIGNGYAKITRISD